MLGLVVVYCCAFEAGLTVPSEGQRPTPHNRYHYIRANGQVKELGQQMESPLC